MDKGITIEGLEPVDLKAVEQAVKEIEADDETTDSGFEEENIVDETTVDETTDSGFVEENMIDEDFLEDDNEEYIEDSPEDLVEMIEGEDKEIPEGKERDTLYDSKGNPVEFRIEGEMYTKEINLSDILLPPRTRNLNKIDVDELEKSILQWGLIEPLHVIPFGEKYLLVHGLRRYYALKNLGYESVICLVDSTRPKATLRFLEVISNNIESYDFYEIMQFGEFIERKQKTFQNDTIENILGLGPGDYLKAKYILQMDQFGIIKEIVSGKRTIKDGFKRLERELDKLAKEKENIDLNDPESYLMPIEEEDNVQSTKNRQPLPAHVYAKIKARDRYICQTCGLGVDSPEITPIFEVHHIIPVSMGGSDNENNLILLCSNCHKIVGAYIDGEFIPPKERVGIYSNIILLGNIARLGLAEGSTPYGFYKDNYKPYW